MAAEQSQLLTTALAVIDGYNKWDIEAILAPRAPECTHQIHPLRLERPLLNNDQYREYFATAAMPHFKHFYVEVIDVSEDVARHRVFVHARSKAESVIGAYANEYVLMFQMTEDDKQLLSFKELVDSGYGEVFFGRLREYLAAQKA